MGNLRVGMVVGLVFYGYWNVTDNLPCGGTVTGFVSAPIVSCQKLISCFPGGDAGDGEHANPFSGNTVISHSVGS